MTISVAVPTIFPLANLETQRASKLGAEKLIRDQVRLVMDAKQSNTPMVERRREKREAYPYPIYLTPVGKDGSIQLDGTIVALGKHLSELGFDFYHRDPLPFRRAIVSFELSPQRYSGLLLDLTWCRFGRHGWYDNGGRFIAAVDSPISMETHPSLIA